MRGKQWRPSGASAIPRPTISCAGSRVMSSPSNTTCPELAGVRPEIERSVVDLPAPLEPIRVTTSPSLDVERDPLQRLDRAVMGVDLLDLQQCHQCLLPEVRLDHARVGPDLGRWPLRDLLAVVEHRDPLGDAHHDLHVVLDQQDRELELVAHLAHEVGQRRDSCGFMPAVGSSSSSSFGSEASARAISTRR